jgi:hypothetical protein
MWSVNCAKRELAVRPSLATAQDIFPALVMGRTIAMKVCSALGLAAALVIVPICALLLSCQAGCNQHVWSEEN